MSWFRREKKRLESTEEKRVHTEGLWTKCESCRQIIWKKDLEANWNVCPRCNFHFKIDSRMRLALLLDGKWTEHDAELTSSDPLEFNDLKAQLALTDGNLSTHLTSLERAGYVKIVKGFRGRKPQTTVAQTAKGRKALANYVNLLEGILGKAGLGG